MKTPSVSIVIPVFNEESHLRDCLEAIARQTVMPVEVIVVDNNSTDTTAAIAKSFPFVRLVSEKRQGVVYARDCGFDVARGDIIGRLDGDTILTPNWVETVQEIFADPSVGAVSGSVHYREVCLSKAFDGVDFRIRRYLAERMSQLGEHFLYGVNMAMRKSAWQKVRAEVCHTRTMHEDLDLAIHLVQQGQKVVFDPRLRVAISARQADASPRAFFHYAYSGPRAYQAHGMISQRYMYPIAWLILALYVPIRMCYRGYNPATGRFSLYCLFYPEVTVGRSSPVTPSLTSLD